MIALLAGTFDPPHHGHFDVIRRAAGLFERLIVAIAVNPEKKPLLPLQTRMELIAAECSGIANVTVDSYSGQSVAFARARGAGVLVRGLRNAADLEYERGLSTVNREAGAIDTVFLICSGAYSHLSSHLVRQAAGAGLPLESMLGARALAALRKHAQ
jgi:pantetheine-phosphate adenylyltransferase